jgi:hypothetical protein
MNTEKMLSIGKIWNQNGFNRIYFPISLDMIGLEVERYNTGNICSAKLDGEKISNSKAGKMITQLNSGKVWFDIPTQKFMSKNLGLFTDDIINFIKELVK